MGKKGGGLSAHGAEKTAGKRKISVNASTQGGGIVLYLNCINIFRMVSGRDP